MLPEYLGPAGGAAGHLDASSADEDDLSSAFAAPASAQPTARVRKPTQRAEESADNSFLQNSSSPAPPSGTASSINRRDTLAYRPNPNFDIEVQKGAAVFDFDEPSHFANVTSPARYNLLKTRTAMGEFKLKAESVTARGVRVAARNREQKQLQEEEKANADAEREENRRKIAALKARNESLAPVTSSGGTREKKKSKGPLKTVQPKSKKKETITVDDDSDSENEATQTRLSPVERHALDLRVVEFICASGGQEYSGHDEHSHYQYFFEYQKEMWPQVVAYCASAGFERTVKQLQRVWHRVWQKYCAVQQEEGVTGGGSGDYPKMSPEDIDDFKAGSLYEMIDLVAKNSPKTNPSILITETSMKRGSYEDEDDDDLTPAQRRKKRKAIQKGEKETAADLAVARFENDKENDQAFNLGWNNISEAVAATAALKARELEITAKKDKNNLAIQAAKMAVEIGDSELKAKGQAMLASMMASYEA